MAEYRVSQSLHRLRGGIFPETHKDLSLSRPLEAVPLPDRLVFPVHHSGGGEGSVLVSVGEWVRQGTPIIETQSGLIHRASRAGQVSAIEPLLDAPGPEPSKACVVITPSGEDDVEYLPALDNPDQESLTERAKAAGLLGLGGGGFPSHQKWQTPLHTLLINAAECEPYLTADDLLMRTEAAEVINGASVLASTHQIPRIVIGIEDNKPEALAALKEAIETYPSDRRFECVVVETKYPSGGERQLIHLTLGLEIPSTERPTDAGILVHNPGTLAALSQALRGQPLTERIVTVTGDAIKRPQNWRVPIGTPILHLLQLSGWQYDRDTQITLGGPMMGQPLMNTSAWVTKTTHCLLARHRTEAPINPCIRCGACAEACPVGLQPQSLHFALEGAALARAGYEGLNDCILCAACNAVCPSNLPLAENFALGRHQLKERDRTEARATAARARFIARTERLQRVAEEAAAKREARRQSSRDLLDKARLARESAE